MYQHLNGDGTPYIFSRGVDYYMPVSPVRAHAPPSEPLSITDSNEIVACVDFFVKFLLVQPLTTTLYMIPGLLILGGMGRLAKRYSMKNRSWNRVTLIPTMVLFSP
jgi:hypothetical protein